MPEEKRELGGKELELMQWSEMQRFLIIQAKAVCRIIGCDFEGELRECLKNEWLSYVDKCQAANKFVNIHSLLVVIYVSLLKIEKPIILGELKRLVNLGYVPYLTLWKSLPKDLKNISFTQKFKPRTFPSTELLAQELGKNFEIALDAFSFNSLNLTYMDCVICRILQMLNLNYFRLFRSVKGTLQQITLRGFLRSSMFLRRIAAVIVFNVKLIYGLIDSNLDKEYTIDDQTWPSLEELLTSWRNSMNNYRDYQNYTISWCQEKIERYLKFCQKNIIPLCTKNESNPSPDDDEYRLDLSINFPEYRSRLKILKFSSSKYLRYSKFDSLNGFHDSYNCLLEVLALYLQIDKISIHRSVVKLESHVLNTHILNK